MDRHLFKLKLTVRASAADDEFHFEYFIELPQTEVPEDRVELVNLFDLEADMLSQRIASEHDLGPISYEFSFVPAVIEEFPHAARLVPQEDVICLSIWSENEEPSPEAKEHFKTVLRSIGKKRFTRKEIIDAFIRMPHASRNDRFVVFEWARRVGLVKLRDASAIPHLFESLLFY